jgi:hypothetical protein
MDDKWEVLHLKYYPKEFAWRNRENKKYPVVIGIALSIACTRIVLLYNPILFAICTITFSKLCKPWHRAVRAYSEHRSVNSVL